MWISTRTKIEARRDQVQHYGSGLRLVLNSTHGLTEYRDFLTVFWIDAVILRSLRPWCLLAVALCRLQPPSDLARPPRELLDTRSVAIFLQWRAVNSVL